MRLNLFKKILASAMVLLLCPTLGLAFNLEDGPLAPEDPIDAAPDQLETNAELEAAIDEKLDQAAQFFATAIDTENFFAPFDDFFAQNECKRRDLFALIQKRDKTGSLIRKGILDPDVTVPDIEAYQRSWKLTSAELYYLRHIDQLEPDPETGKSEAAKLRSETIDLYPEIGSQIRVQLDRYWLDRYEKKRTGEYANCQASFKLIGEKAREIKQNFITAIDNLDRAWADLKEEYATTKDTFKTSYDNLTEYLDNGLSTDVSDLLAGNFANLAKRYKDYLKYDFGPLSSYLEQSEAKARQTENREDALTRQLQEDSNRSIIDLTRETVNNANSYEAALTNNFAEVNRDTSVGVSDNAIWNVWDELQKSTDQVNNFAKTVNPDNKTSLTTILADLNDRQCRERE